MLQTHLLYPRFGEVYSLYCTKLIRSHFEKCFWIKPSVQSAGSARESCLNESYVPVLRKEKPDVRLLEEDSINSFEHWVYFIKFFLSSNKNVMTCARNVGWSFSCFRFNFNQQFHIRREIANYGSGRILRLTTFCENTVEPQHAPHCLGHPANFSVLPCN